jgi:hypothetical protein
VVKKRMVNKGLIVGAAIGIGALVYTLLDKFNYLPWSNNVGQKWWWERIIPAQTARANVIFQPQVRPQVMQAMPTGIISPSGVWAVSTQQGSYNGVQGAVIASRAASVNGKYR